MQQKYLHIVCVIISLVTSINSQNILTEGLKEFFEEAKPVEDLILGEAYPVTVFNVTTEDGYILTVHRIVHGKNGSVGSRYRQPVFLQHGLFDSSAAWVLRGHENGLGFILADAGYDVWMSNCRGNTFSRAHTSLSPDRDKKFWDFSVHEMGYYDLPAVIDFILATTSHTQVVYIAHSMGTTMLYIMLSTRPEYNSKVLAAFNMAPVSYMYHQTSPVITMVVTFQTQVSWILNIIGIYEVMPINKLNSKFYQIICSGWRQAMCDVILKSVIGIESPEFDKDSLPTILKYIPAGTSLKNLMHFSQFISEEHSFRYYDYGYLGNFLSYGQLNPPPYPLSNIRVPLYLYYCDKDHVADLKDLNHFMEDVPSVVYKYRVSEPEFSHYDYIWGLHVKTLVYDDIVKQMKKLHQK